MEHHSAVLLRRLNPYCAKALEAAASLCQTRAHASILPEHWLLKLLELGEGDVTVIARRYEWDMESIWQDLLSHLDRLPRSVRSRPALSDNLETLLKQAWLAASLDSDYNQIRSQHLLQAMVESPKLVACDGLWPLLSLRSSQLERLRPLLDAQSDERPEVQQVVSLSQSPSVLTDEKNLGSDHLMQPTREQPEATEADLHELLRPVLRDHFQPALLARFQTVIYRPLEQAAMRTIVQMKLNQVSQRLACHYGMKTDISESLYDALTAACLLPDTGARNIDSLLNQQILPVLSQ